MTSLVPFRSGASYAPGEAISTSFDGPDFAKTILCRIAGRAKVHRHFLRLRPGLITVGAPVIALFPLTYRGGRLWEPMCYTQIGGLLLATIITKILVPVLYAIFVQDLKILKWEEKRPVGMDGLPPDGKGEGAPIAPVAAQPTAPAPTV